MMQNVVNVTDKAYHHLYTFNRFREGKEKVLIMTNCCARGMHIDIPLVVNYDITVDAHNRADCETFLHR